MAADNYTLKAMCICIQTGWYGGKNIPVGIEDVPGTGKTEIVDQIAGKMHEFLVKQGLATKGFTFGSLGLPQTMPEDIGGIPFINTELQAMIRYPLGVIRECMNTEFGIILLDEVTSGSIATGAAAMTGIQSHRFGDVVLSEKTAIVGAWNPAECAAAGRDLAAPEVNRWVMLEGALATNEEFFDYLAGGPGAVADIPFLPPDWEEKGLPRARALVRSYLIGNQKAINDMRSGVVAAHNSMRPWASQRAWANVMRLLAACFSLGYEASSDVAYALVKGMIGEGNADGFIAYLRDMDLPDPEEILKEALKDATTEEDFKARDESIRAAFSKAVWDRPDKVRVAFQSVAIAAQREGADRGERWEAAWVVIRPLCETHPDFVLDAAGILCKSVPEGVSIPKAAATLFQVRKGSGLHSS